MKSGRMWWIAVFLPFALALAAYAWEGLQTPLFDPQRAAQDSFLAAVERLPGEDADIDSASAAAYWARYPDVASDRYYGRQGPLGQRGALQHYRDHGRSEGRQWGP